MFKFEFDMDHFVHVRGDAPDFIAVILSKRDVVDVDGIGAIEYENVGCIGLFDGDGDDVIIGFEFQVVAKERHGSQFVEIEHDGVIFVQVCCKVFGNDRLKKVRSGHGSWFLWCCRKCNFGRWWSEHV